MIGRSMGLQEDTRNVYCINLRKKTLQQRLRKYVLTESQRSLVLHWRAGGDLWSGQSLETNRWTLQTLRCPPLPPHKHSSPEVESAWGQTGRGDSENTARSTSGQREKEETCQKKTEVHLSLWSCGLASDSVWIISSVRTHPASTLTTTAAAARRNGASQRTTFTFKLEKKKTCPTCSSDAADPLNTTAFFASHFLGVTWLRAAPSSIWVRPRERLESGKTGSASTKSSWMKVHQKRTFIWTALNHNPKVIWPLTFGNETWKCRARETNTVKQRLPHAVQLPFSPLLGQRFSHQTETGDDALVHYQWCTGDLWPRSVDRFIVPNIKRKRAELGPFVFSPGEFSDFRTSQRCIVEKKNPNWVYTLCFTWFKVLMPWTTTSCVKS